MKMFQPLDFADMFRIKDLKDLSSTKFELQNHNRNKWRILLIAFRLVFLSSEVRKGTCTEAQSFSRTNSRAWDVSSQSNLILPLANRQLDVLIFFVPNIHRATAINSHRLWGKNTRRTRIGNTRLWFANPPRPGLVLCFEVKTTVTMTILHTLRWSRGIWVWCQACKPIACGQAEFLPFIKL